jgi:hypothetical protein
MRNSIIELFCVNVFCENSQQKAKAVEATIPVINWQDRPALGIDMLPSGGK